MSETGDALTQMQAGMGGALVVSSAEERAFELVQRKAKVYSTSDMVPETYRNKIGNCIIAMEMASRMNLEPLQVMQSLYVIHGNPAWKSEFIIARINLSGKFKGPLKYRFTGTIKDGDRECTAYALDKDDGLMAEMAIQWSVVEAEGWNKKAGSKWLTMPDQMFRYRAAAWFARAYCPEVLHGVAADSEIIDGEFEVVERATPPENHFEKTPDHDPETGEVVEKKPVPEIKSRQQKAADTKRKNKEKKAKEDKEAEEAEAAEAARAAQDAATEPPPEPVECISNEQAKSLVDLIVKCALDDDEKSMLQKVAGVDELFDLPAEKYITMIAEIDERDKFNKGVE